ncbi:MAG: M15 family metallopeptidase [Clostridia bacterium]|nr:M15 family metallopeptidase [Clostridia bacterium]
MSTNGKRLLILAVLCLGLIAAGFTADETVIPTFSDNAVTTTVNTTTTTTITTTTATTTTASTTTTTIPATTTTKRTTTTTNVTTTTTAATTTTALSVAAPLATTSTTATTVTHQAENNTSVTTKALSETLDPTYKRLLLVNADHPLPSDFDNTADLVTIEKEYLNGSLNKIDGGVYPYLMALLTDARAQGVSLYVRSPYRSYATQEMLFNNKVKKVIAAGTPADEAEAKAAQAVARPGTSEHQTGLAIDFNVASSTFEKSPGFRWMMANAENYGFILRYPKNKTDVTGIMYESWHWRFVGINAAKEINAMNVVLEEYLAAKE